MRRRTGFSVTLYCYQGLVSEWQVTERIKGYTYISCLQKASRIWAKSYSSSQESILPRKGRRAASIQPQVLAIPPYRGWSVCKVSQPNPVTAISVLQSLIFLQLPWPNRTKRMGFKTEQEVPRAWFSLSWHSHQHNLGWTLRMALPWRPASLVLRVPDAHSWEL